MERMIFISELLQKSKLNHNAKQGAESNRSQLFSFPLFLVVNWSLSNLGVYTHSPLTIIPVATTVYSYNKNKLLVTQINCNVSYSYPLY